MGWRNAYRIQFFLVSFVFLIRVSHSSNSQNLETFYPFFTQLPGNPVPQPSPPSPRKTTDRKTVAVAVAATAASTLLLSVALFLFAIRCSRSRRVGTQETRYEEPPRTGSGLLSRLGSRVKGVIVNENGCDVVYWKGQGSTREILSRKWASLKKNDEPIQVTPLLEGNPSSSHLKEHQETAQPSSSHESISPTFSFPHTNGAAPPPPPPPPSSRGKNKADQGQATPPPPPSGKGKNKADQGPAPPPPPPNGKGKNKAVLGMTPPPPPNAKGKGKESEEQIKLKPLHWDKINTNTDHSMVWEKLNNGSFKFDNGMMEALFGTVAANRSSPKKEVNSVTGRITILDPRKSQNIGIVLKSLPVSRNEILDSLRNGHELETDVIEKLISVAPSKEEKLLIIGFDGDPGKLPDAESFLCQLLKSLPSAFDTLSAMHFKANYRAEIQSFKQKLAIVEAACREVRTKGLFMKMLEAVLKAGNKMNAGTSRGNAEAFKLTSLKKLSDVKSTDGKTTLLYFVVEEVVRFEGRKLFSSMSPNYHGSEENSLSIEERDREYKMLGLPVVGGISSQYSNVKMAATLEPDTLSDTLSSLETRLRENDFQLSESVVKRGGSGSLKEIKSFYEKAEEELNELKGEEKRVKDAVNRATEYYQSGAWNASKSNHIKLFVIITEFLNMVDKTCVEISRNLQTIKGRGSSPYTSKKVLRFPNLPAHFESEISNGSSD